MSKIRKALERANEFRGSKNLPEKSANDLLHPLLRQNRVERQTDPQKIEITYSKTKVEQVDRHVLKKNKILSLFKENQTTDQVDNLRTQLLDKLEQLGGNSFLVTSANPGEGKTFISVNLGASIAQQLDRTVLIVDTDLRNPWKYHYDFASDFWGLKPAKGLADYLEEKAEIEEILINPGIDKLTLLPAGRHLPNASELLGSNRMVQLIEEVKKRYAKDRVVIFDCPALLRFTDPLVISDMVDGILLVVEAEKTTPEDLKKVVGLLKGKNLLGTVFNKSRENFTNDYV